MTPCLGKALWIASATARTSSSSRVSPTANAPQLDRRRKSARKPRAELWGTSRKCRHGFLNAIFFELRGRNGLSLRNQANEGRADAFPLYRIEPHDCQGGSKLIETESENPGWVNDHENGG